MEIAVIVIFIILLFYIFSLEFIIVEYIFPRVHKYYMNEIEKLKKRNQEKLETINSIESQLKISKNENEIITRILKLISKKNIRLEFYNKILMVDSGSKEFMILVIYDLDSKDINPKVTHINYSLKRNYFENYDYIFIDDIQSDVKSKGYGTLGLNYLKQIGLEKKCSKLSGLLSKDDFIDHGDRLIHFYTKNKFEIKLRNDGTNIYANIEYHFSPIA